MRRDVKRMRGDAADIFARACARVNAAESLRRTVALQGESLRVGDRTYDLGRYQRIIAVGAGKASSAMAQALEEIVGGRLQGGHINTKYGFGLPLKRLGQSEAAHPIPDEAGVEGTERIVDWVQGADAHTLVFFLASGGGSALLPAPVEGVSLAEKQETTGLLLGANIKELNAVRKHLSRVKGGQLARLAYPATVVSLMISDVIGNPLDVIASGPTVADPTTYGECRALIDGRGVWDELPVGVRRHLEAGCAGDIPETPKGGDEALRDCQNLVLADVDMAIEAARLRALELGYAPLVLSTGLEGEAADTAHIYAALARQIRERDKPVARPACVIAGGETTVALLGGGRDGMGGRNQALALSGALEITGDDGVVLFSGGTDGDDGVKRTEDPNVAGAVVDGLTVARGRALGLDARAHLEANNAYPFFAALGDHVHTGPTHTNVMDIALLLVS